MLYEPDRKAGPRPGTETKTHGNETTNTWAIARARTGKARTRHEITRKSRNRTAKPKKRQGPRQNKTRFPIEILTL